MAATQNHFGSVFSKYKTLLISITAFLLLIAALLGLNLYSSLQIGQGTAQINASAYMRDLTQAITRDLFNLRLSYGEDPNTPHMSNTIGRLQNNINLYSQNLDALQNGGELIDADGDSVDIAAGSLEASQTELNAMEQEWAQLRPLIQTYLQNARSVNASLTDLDLAVNQSQSSSIALSDEVNAVASDIKTTAYDRADFLTYLQFFGILIIIIYFIIFIFFVLRQLLKADTEVIAAQQETAEILDTVNEGLFLVDENLIIGNQHSQALNKLLGIENIAGKSLNDLLSQVVTRKDMDVVTEFIQQLFNPRVKAKLISDLNPLDQIRAGIADENGQIQMHYLKFSFTRVYSGQDIIRILVSVADITRTILLEERLESERIKNNEQVEMLTAILQVDQRMLGSFLRNARRTTHNINNILRQNSRTESALREKARLIFREAHSLKGEASAMGLQSFVGLTEELEERVNTLGKNPKLVGDDFIPLAVSLEQLITALERVESLVDKIGSFAVLGNGNKNDVTGNATLGEARQVPSSYGHYFVQFAEQVAERNGKKIEVDAHGFDDVQLEEYQEDMVKDLTVQLIRNAVVHGIESPAVRRDKGKNEIGKIQISLSNIEQKRQYRLLVEDDGQGIDYTAIKEKLTREGRLSEEQAAHLTKKELLTAIFRSGFSTLQKSNVDAGRGVGMDVIKARLIDLEGKIRVESEKGDFTRFTVIFPMEAEG